ncbi:MAG TPA: hypothetical protein VII11_00395 [Bacteroidota bacterium]
MGQQQLMLIILGTIIVGIAIAVGILMFKSNAEESSRNAIINDLAIFAMRAREAYIKPAYLGGLDRDFTDVTINRFSTVTENENARYYVESSTQEEVVLVGVGKMVAHTDTIRIRMRVTEKTQTVETIN